MTWPSAAVAIVGIVFFSGLIAWCAWVAHKHEWKS